jgi:hypothetical protein
MKTFSKITLALLTMSAVAVAQPKADKAPTPPAKDAKAQVAPTTKDAKPTMPTVPPELVEMAKATSGNWKCKGEAFEMDGSKTPVTATNKTKADLDKWWISESMEVKGMKMGSFKMTSYTTFDAASKKWRRVGMDNWGGQMVGTADAAPMGKPMTFNLDTLGPQGAGQFRDHVDPSDMKAGLKIWGEMSMDKGKTWMKVYEMTCKK